MLLFLTVGLSLLVPSKEQVPSHFFSILSDVWYGGVKPVGLAGETRGFLGGVHMCYSWTVCSLVHCSLACCLIASWPLSVSFIATGRNNYPDIMKWVVLEFNFRWHWPLMQLVSLNTFCLNKPCSWKWFQNSLFLVAVSLLLFLKLYSQQYHKYMSMTDSKILLKLTVIMNRVVSRYDMLIIDFIA